MLEFYNTNPKLRCLEVVFPEHMVGDELMKHMSALMHKAHLQGFSYDVFEYGLAPDRRVFFTRDGNMGADTFDSKLNPAQGFTQVDLSTAMVMFDLL